MYKIFLKKKHDTNVNFTIFFLLLLACYFDECVAL